jgi:hypothetical protein
MDFQTIYVWCDALRLECGQLLPLLSSMERLDIECEDVDPLDWQGDVDHTHWLEFFRPFIAVPSLHNILWMDGLITHALQELTGVTVMEVLPAFRSLFVMDLNPSGSVRQRMYWGKLGTARESGGNTPTRGRSSHSSHVDRGRPLLPNNQRPRRSPIHGVLPGNNGITVEVPFTCKVPVMVAPNCK